MSKFCLIPILCCVIALLFCIPKPIYYALSLKDATYYIYSQEGAEYDTRRGVRAVITQCDYLSVGNLSRQIEAIQGFSLSINAEASQIDVILQQLNVTILQEQTIGSIYTLYGYSPLIIGAINIDNYKVNVQIAYCDGVLHVGSPLILGSY